MIDDLLGKMKKSNQSIHLFHINQWAVLENLLQKPWGDLDITWNEDLLNANRPEVLSSQVSLFDLLGNPFSVLQVHHDFAVEQLTH